MYIRQHLDVAKYWKMRNWYIRVHWRPNLRRRTQLLDRQAGGVIMDDTKNSLTP